MSRPQSPDQVELADCTDYAQDAVYIRHCTDTLNWQNLYTLTHQRSVAEDFTATPLPYQAQIWYHLGLAKLRLKLDDAGLACFDYVETAAAQAFEHPDTIEPAERKALENYCAMLSTWRVFAKSEDVVKVLQPARPENLVSLVSLAATCV